MVVERSVATRNLLVKAHADELSIALTKNCFHTKPDSNRDKAKVRALIQTSCSLLETSLFRRSEVEVIILPQALEIIIAKQVRSDLKGMSPMGHEEITMLARQEQSLLSILVPRRLIFCQSERSHFVTRQRTWYPTAIIIRSSSLLFGIPACQVLRSRIIISPFSQFT